jgi:hypothetical protein
MRIGAVSGFYLIFAKPPKEPNVQSEALRNLIAACIKSIQLCKYVGCMKFQLIVLQRCIPKFQEMLLSPLSKLAFSHFLVLFLLKPHSAPIFSLVASSKSYWFLWHDFASEYFVKTLSSQFANGNS